MPSRTSTNTSPFEHIFKVAQAMKEEYDALMKNGMWSLVPRAYNTNVVNGKWVYKLKRVKNGAITHYKTRFVAKGFRQQPGNNKGTVDNIICQLRSTFALKDLGPLSYFFGIEIILAFSYLKRSIFWSYYKVLVVGSLQYVTLSWPDIAFAVNNVISILFLKLSQMLTGLEIQMIDGPQEAEYKALVDTVAELTWLQALLNELGIHSSSTRILWCVNLGATYLSANPIFHARTKHIEINYHFVWEKVAQGDLRVQHISTHDQIADIFTKPLPTPRFLFLISKLQVVARP
ncbi:integrase [Tanacetum coccineum]